jgi:Rod binding domain-containing protein
MQPLSSSAATDSTASGPAPSPRLVHAAHEFEAQMMKELMQPLNRGSALTRTEDESESDDDAGSGGALGEFASEALGRALSEQGGFGIATSIVRQLTNPGHHTNAAGVTGSLHGDTVINFRK